MQSIIDFISQPWAWYVAGPIIALTMFLMLYFGKSFGVSSNLRTLCAMGGGGKAAKFFNFDWKAQRWNLIFAFGTLLGGFLAAQFLMPTEQIALNPKTVEALKTLGINQPGAQYLPPEIFGEAGIGSVKGLFILLFGGFLVGFGARYAGGCTSGHAISGLSNLQIPSLIAVIGFFIGGLTMTFLVLPLLF